MMVKSYCPKCKNENTREIQNWKGEKIVICDSSKCGGRYALKWEARFKIETAEIEYKETKKFKNFM